MQPQQKPELERLREFAKRFGLDEGNPMPEVPSRLIAEAWVGFEKRHYGAHLQFDAADRLTEVIESARWYGAQLAEGKR